MLHTKQVLDKITGSINRRADPGQLYEVYRLFNGFYEGYPGLVLDRFKSTVVISNHLQPGAINPILSPLQDWLLNHIKGLDGILLKQRQHFNDRMRQGVMIHGKALPDRISEFGVIYALDLQLNQDASFYLDTRNLRRWLLENMAGLKVFNTFAYTGSLGVAAGAGGASHVVQTDLNQGFLKLSQRSWELNHLLPKKMSILTGDFFRVAGRIRHEDHLFDCVILDPPFFSITDKGRVDLQGETPRLINKVRPLVAHQGYLIVINNALFYPGKSFMGELDALCQSDYLSFVKKIDIPEDVTGYPETITESPPCDPSPFNHPTKIAILKVLRKDQRDSTFFTQDERTSSGMGLMP